MIDSFTLFLVNFPFLFYWGWKGMGIMVMMENLCEFSVVTGVAMDFINHDAAL